jgi:hypothetical protein
MENNLKLDMPKGLVSMISKRHNGNQNLDNEKRAKAWYLMQKLYDDYQKYKNKENNLLFVEWDEKQIEKHFGKPIFYNAHKRLRNYRDKLESIWKEMFFILTNMDGINCGFDSSVIGPEEIYLDFKSKYVDKHFVKSEEGE